MENNDLVLENGKTDWTLKQMILPLIIIIVFIITVSSIVISIMPPSNEKLRQEEVRDYMLSTIPQGSHVYFTSDWYEFLTGFKNTYRQGNLMPNVESMDKMEDWCDYIDGMDYLLFTGVQKKYLGQTNLDCAYKKFRVIKVFPNYDFNGQDIEILKKKENILIITNSTDYEILNGLEK